MLLTFWKNELLRASKINQLRYADTKQRRKTGILYLFTKNESAVGKESTY